MERILARSICWCSPVGVSRSIQSDAPSRPGFRKPRSGWRSKRTTTTFLCVEAALAFLKGKGTQHYSEIFANYSDVCYVKRVLFTCQTIVFIRVTPGVPAVDRKNSDS